MLPGDLNRLFIETHHLHFRRAHTRYAAFGLGEGQPRLLRRIAASPGVCQAELARQCNLEPATVTVTLARMEKAGLVARRGDADDLRVMRVSLTPEGLALHETLNRIFLEAEEECFHGFSQEERNQLSGYLTRMRDNLLCAEKEPVSPEEPSV